MSLRVIVIVLVAGTWTHEFMEMENKVRITSMLGELCPHVETCRNNASGLVRPSTCCTECSCEEDCGQDVHCCFQSDQERYLQKQTSEIKCLVLQSPQPKTVLDHETFYVTGPKITPGNEVVIDRCDTSKVAPWGSFFPVFSLLTGTIYANRLCAEENDETDIVESDALVQCDLTMVEFTASHLEKDLWPDGCIVTFSFQRNDDINIHQRECYLKRIDYCTTVPVDVKFLNLTKYDIIEGCSSGLISPYRASNLFSNPFCMLCSNKSGLVQRENTCIGEQRGLGSILFSFGYLIDMKQWREHKKNSVAENVACFNGLGIGEDSPVCRPILCPVGKVRSVSTGRCYFASERWFSDGYSVYVKLQAESIKNINNIHQLSVSNFQHKASSSWKTIGAAVAFENKTNELAETGCNCETRHVINRTVNKVGYILVAMQFMLDSGPPEDVVGALDEMVSELWTVVIGDNQMTLRPSISEFSEWFLEPGNQTFVPKCISGLNSFIPNTLRGSSLDFSFYVLDGMITGSEIDNLVTLKKIFFCDRIEILPDEFDLYPHGSILHYKPTNQVLFDSEFTLTIRSTGERVAQICLGDSGFLPQIENITNSSAKTSPFAEMVCLLGVMWTLISCSETKEHP